MSEHQDLLGEVVTWDQGQRELSAETVRDAIEKAGLNIEMPELRITTAFGRAVKDLKKSKLIRRRKEARKSPEKRFQLNRIDEDGAQVNYDYDCTLAVDVETGKVACPEDTELAARVEQDVQAELGTRHTGDITKLVQMMFRSNADLFPINPRKPASAAYFVPHVHQEFTNKVEQFLRIVGGNLWRFPVPRGTEQGNDSVRDAVRNGLNAMVEELNEAVEGWEVGTTRKSTTEKALARWEQIAFKASSYAQYLDSEKERLGESLEAAKAVLAAKILEVTSEPEQDEQPAEAPAPDTQARKLAMSDGWDAYEGGADIGANPYESGPEATYWVEGWKAAQEADTAIPAEESQAA